MADNKHYYYLKLKDNFFESNEIQSIELMENGKNYCLILLKMYLKSLKDEGRLMVKDAIPYTPELFARMFNEEIDTVKKAIEIFEQYGLIEKLDSGAIFMSDIQNYIGRSNTEADRKREYRARIKKEREEGQNKGVNPK